MKMYCIKSSDSISAQLLRESCQKKGVEFGEIEAEGFDYSQKIVFEKGDLLYRISTDKKSRVLEKFLVDKKVTTFYANYQRALFSCNNLAVYLKENIPTPETIFRLTREKHLLKKYGELLGFPLIIKALGGSHGVGVIKVDSLSSLYTIADYLLSRKDPDSFALKKFIDITCSARLIVLGNKVIDSIEYVAPEGDFRSNEGAVPNVRIKKFSPEVEATAVRATQVLGLEFAGVDILIDKDGKHYLAETNFPCFFPRAQMLTGTPISDMMVDYLIQKAQHHEKN